MAKKIELFREAKGYADVKPFIALLLMNRKITKVSYDWRIDSKDSPLVIEFDNGYILELGEGEQGDFPAATIFKVSE